MVQALLKHQCCLEHLMGMSLPIGFLMRSQRGVLGRGCNRAEGNCFFRCPHLWTLYTKRHYHKLLVLQTLASLYLSGPPEPACITNAVRSHAKLVSLTMHLVVVNSDE